jgi:hypothetical protein
LIIRQDIIEQCGSMLSDLDYAYRRYNLPYCFLLIESSTESNWISSIESKIRQTDKIFLIKKDLVAIVFPFTDACSKGFKAAENLLTLLENGFPSVRFYMGLSCRERSDKDKNIDVVAGSIYALSKAKEFNENRIEDDSDIR